VTITNLFIGEILKKKFVSIHLTVNTVKRASQDTYGDCVRVVYSLNSESWMVKNGRKSRLNLRGDIMLTRAWTVFAHRVGTEVITTSGCSILLLVLLTLSLLLLLFYPDRQDKVPRDSKIQEI